MYDRHCHLRTGRRTLLSRLHISRLQKIGRLSCCWLAVGWCGTAASLADEPLQAGPTAVAAGKADTAADAGDATAKWNELSEFFTVPEPYQGQLGEYRSLLAFDDKTAKEAGEGAAQVRTPADWARRREEIRSYWHSVMGQWPALLEQPRMKILASEHVGSHTRHTIEIEVAADRFVGPEYLLVPDGEGPFPAVLVTWYNSADAAGLTEKWLGSRDFGLQLAERGYVTLCLGSTNGEDVRKPTIYESIQPLSYLAYTAANTCNLLASLPEVQPDRIGIIGHSYGGKWAMYASCLHDKFACAVWSDPGIVWNEADPSANYWDPWYLGQDLSRSPEQQRKRGLVSKDNPRTGAYRTLVAENRDMHELHALMAPRPFLVSGGAQDRPDHWVALNHTIAINKLLGYTDRVGMTMREGHSPTTESNEQAFGFFDFFLKYSSPAGDDGK